jgi:hypothetical protein
MEGVSTVVEGQQGRLIHLMLLPPSKIEWLINWSGTALRTASTFRGLGQDWYLTVKSGRNSLRVCRLFRVQGKIAGSTPLLFFDFGRFELLAVDDVSAENRPSRIHAGGHNSH